jgi:hypothetical protein
LHSGSSAKILYLFSGSTYKMLTLKCLGRRPPGTLMVARKEEKYIKMYPVKISCRDAYCTEVAGGRVENSGLVLLL